MHKLRDALRGTGTNGRPTGKRSIMVLPEDEVQIPAKSCIAYREIFRP